jgi:23S rRNA (adenine1618-N6)-methyltransferase
MVLSLLENTETSSLSFHSCLSLHVASRWFTSMVGRKMNLKFLISKVREAGATVVKTTEFVQGQTARWGLAWSFLPPRRNLIASNAPIKTNISFMLHVIFFPFPF